MQITGLFSPEHLVQTFIEREYAFKIFYSNDVEIRIAFSKGMWQIVKLRNNTIEDYFEFLDTPEVAHCDNPVLAALIKQIIVQNKTKYHDWWRQYPASVVADVLAIWAGDEKKILLIDVVKGERNSYLSSVNGFTIQSE